MKKIFLMANLNNKSYKSFSRNSRVNIIISSILFLLITSFGVSINKLNKNFNDKNFYLREISITTGDSVKIEDNVVDKIELIEGVEDIHVFYALYPEDYLKVKIDDKVLKSVYLLGSHTNHSVFSKKHIMEINNGLYFNPIIYGRSFNIFDKCKAIIDENYAYILGYSNPETIIGKNISIEIAGFITDNIEIIGVHDYSLGREGLNRLDNISEMEKSNFLESQYNISPIILSHDIIDYFQMNSGGLNLERTGQHRVNVFSRSTSEVSEISKKIEKITSHDIFNEINNINKKAESIRELQLFIYIISFIILLISISSIVNVLIIKINAQKELAILMNKLGYKKKDILYIYILDNFFTFAKSSIIYTVITYIFSLFVDILLVESYSEISTISKFLFVINPVLILTYTTLLLIIISLITLIVSYIQIFNNESGKL